MAEALGRISAIAYGPVKGARQIEVSSADVTKEGVVGDKEYAIVESKPDGNGVYHWISQREYPQLALIIPQIVHHGMVLTWNGKEPLYVPRDRNGPDITVKIWEDVTPGATDQGLASEEWLTDHIGVGAKLVRAGDSYERAVSTKWGQNDSNIRFQDSYPIHWFTQASLDELNRRLVAKGKEPVPWNRFRPNIIVTGEMPPDIEHEVYQGQFGETPFIDIKPCDRCPVPQVDHMLGRKINNEPNATLLEYKTWKKPTDGKIYPIFGENALPQKSGEIHVGQEVIVVEFRKRVTYGERRQMLAMV